MPEETDWEPLTSSSGATAFRYDASLGILSIQFDGGFKGVSIYEYPADQEEVAGLRSASSAGRFIHYNLKHKGRRVR